MSTTQSKRGSKAADKVEEDEIKVPDLAPVEEDERGASDPVKVSLVSALPGHRFRIPYADDPEDALTIDAEGVYVERSAVEEIQAAADRSGVTVKVEEL
jgi:hypothetical protein